MFQMFQLSNKAFLRFLVKPQGNKKIFFQQNQSSVEE